MPFIANKKVSKTVGKPFIIYKKASIKVGILFELNKWYP